jgi:hypothetical protein
MGAARWRTEKTAARGSDGRMGSRSVKDHLCDPQESSPSKGGVFRRRDIDGEERLFRVAERTLCAVARLRRIRLERPMTKASGAASADPAKRDFRMRVRMYRHGSGDCFLLSFPRRDAAPFQLLIDCGALARDTAKMTELVEEIRDTLISENPGDKGKARLDVVVGTHEHKDHLSGFNQARDVFSNEFDFGEVWLAWTEDLSQKEIRDIKTARREAGKKLKAAVSALALDGAPAAIADAAALLQFSADDDSVDSKTVAAALEYLKLRGRQPGIALRFLKPGAKPLTLKGVDGVKVFVLGPPLDPILLKSSEVTEAMKQDGTIYNMSPAGLAGVDALAAAAAADSASANFRPFSLPVTNVDMENAPRYNEEPWRRIDHDWMGALGQVALDLDNDTNNSSLVLAFEFEETGEVLLFAADAQVGNWLSWRNLTFRDGERRVPAMELLSRTVFYKVGHHCSHNATLRKGGLESMHDERLVAFIPLDIETASKQGAKEHGGWDMPAAPLFKALKQKTAGTVVISDVKKKLSKEARAAGIESTKTYIDYFLT